MFDYGIVNADAIFAAIDAGESTYQQALQQARQGKFPAALKQFESLIGTYPTNRRYYYDYIAVLGWAEQDQQVVEQLPRLDVPGTPIYVLETVAKSSRNLGNYDVATDMYRVALKKDKRRLQSREGLVMALVDNGHADEALQVLDAAPADQSGEKEILQARAYILYRKQDYYAALSVYEKILSKTPEDHDAQRGLILTTARMGAPHQAVRIAIKSPGLLTKDELDTIEEEAIAMDIRWSELRFGSAAQRFMQTDEIIFDLEKKINALEAQEQSDSPLARRYQFDLIEALASRQRMDIVAVLYEQLAADNVMMPPYILTTAADAYLYLEQPQQARDLYLQVLAQQPDNFDASIGLYYAYEEAEDHDQARATIDDLANRIPVWISRDNGVQPNPQKVQADTTAALDRAYSDQLEDAYRTLQNLNMQAPYNADIRSALAYVEFYRGWLRRSLSDFELAMAADSKQLGAQTGHANALLNIAEFQAADAEIQQLAKDNPDNSGVLDLERQWELYNMHELRVDVARGWNSGTQVGTDDLTLAAYLYARPIHYNYRPFVLGWLERARFPEGDVNYRRYGAGLEYRRRDLELAGTLTTGPGEYDTPGLGASVGWMPDDYWRFDIAADSYSNDLPSQARLSNIDGWSVSLHSGYRFHESRRIDLFLQQIDFSDDNLRTAGRLSYMERLVTGQRYKLDGLIEFSASQNTRDDAPYYNPSRDSFEGITAINEWLTWRYYTHAFRQRVYLGVGNYQESGFSSNNTWNARYEHDWELGDQLNLLYGIARSRHIYDGDSEYRTQIDLSLDWRF